MSRPTLTRARESGVRWHGTVGKMFPNSSTVKLTFQKLGPNVQISVWTWRKMDYSAIFGF